MSSDSSDPTPSNTPIDVAVEGLVLRPDAFRTPVPGSEPTDGKVTIATAHAAAAREKADFSITNSLQSIPLWALIPIIGVGIAAGSYLNPNLGLGPNVKGYNYALELPGDAGDVTQAADENDPKVWIAKGKGIYSNNCAVCHGPGGEGLPGQFPPLKNSEFVIHGEQVPTAILLRGIAGPLQVNGKGYNGVMNPLGAGMSAKQLAQLLSYIRNDWGNKASIIYDDQITEFKKTLTVSTPFSEAELRAIPIDSNLPPSKKAAPPADGAAPAAAGAPAAAPAAGTPVTTPAPAAPAK